MDEREKKSLSSEYLERFYNEVEALSQYSAAYIILLSRLNARSQDTDEVSLTDEEKNSLLELEGGIRTLAFNILTRLKALSKPLGIKDDSLKEFEEYYEEVKNSSWLLSDELVEALNQSLHRILISNVTYDETREKHHSAMKALSE